MARIENMSEMSRRDSGQNSQTRNRKKSHIQQKDEERNQQRVFETKESYNNRGKSSAGIS
jgi:hypothetical protein